MVPFFFSILPLSVSNVSIHNVKLISIIKIVIHYGIERFLIIINVNKIKALITNIIAIHTLQSIP